MFASIKKHLSWVDWTPSDMEADCGVVYHLRDLNADLVNEWEVMFEPYAATVKPSVGDVFLDAPAADAIVCPANSFGFMGNGSVDAALLSHFGESLQEQVLEEIQEKHHGELLVGQAMIVSDIHCVQPDRERYNQGAPIQHVIMAPTMRVPVDVSYTPNAYLAFRAAILAIRNHNENSADQIESVIVPGLATWGGLMPTRRCAYQMLQAYESFVLGKSKFRSSPHNKSEMIDDHFHMCQVSRPGIFQP
ncbi:uncharacterized protein LOC131953152 [Physella acuta]|uniref:uncharacterized protein LOC131953152 n=1 Tax=Physella acuta TaxID=109671 RepID=UPI0027DDBA7C|nr:uncharacterized protein LOC131953152 [Physella acuta]